ncbi:MAG: undecaprenyl-diphosphatase UppP [Deltaproteobacteria bacterium]|nr:undecaprenyl-diphosphatase UppP [Deltaproteobacteria bacterium]
MGLLQATVLGLVQGLTEFLPVSSTAHLRLVPELFGWPDPGAAYSAVIQLGTTAAVILYFWKDLLSLSGAVLAGLRARQPLATPGARLGWGVLLGTFPIGVLGLLLKKAVETHFRSLYVIAASLVLLALLLWWVERRASHARTVQEMTLADALVVGVFQAVALLPGASRSGTTLTGALWRGFKREDAARFSFLLSIPATALAGLFELKHLLEATERPSLLALAVGTAVAFGSGLGAIAGLLRYLRTRTTGVFIAYRVALGGLLFALLGAGVLKPSTGLENVPPGMLGTVPAVPPGLRGTP